MTTRFSPETLASTPRSPSAVEFDVRHETELAEVSADLDGVQRRIVARKREIAGYWTQASTADRLLAVDRLLRDGNLSAEQVASLSALQSRVRTAFHAARAERKRLADAADASSAGLARVEAEVVRQEGERDRHIGLQKLTEELWRTSESFVVPAAVSTRQGPFRELLAFEALLEQRLLRLQQPHSKMGIVLLDPVEEPELEPTPRFVPVARIEPARPQPVLHRLMQLFHSPAAALGLWS